MVGLFRPFYGRKCHVMAIPPFVASHLGLSNLAAISFRIRTCCLLERIYSDPAEAPAYFLFAVCLVMILTGFDTDYQTNGEFRTNFLEIRGISEPDQAFRYSSVQRKKGGKRHWFGIIYKYIKAGTRTWNPINLG